MMNYDDDAVYLDDHGITIKNSYAPGRARHISYAAVRSVDLFEPGRFSGRHRLVGIGFRRPRHFFHWDRARSAKTRAIALDAGGFFRTVISPSDHERVVEVLAAQGVNVEHDLVPASS